MLGAALTVEVTTVEVKEIVHQAVPYVGMAKVFDFIHSTNDVLAERGIELPLSGQSTTTPEKREAKGLAIEKQIVGSDVVEDLYPSAPDDQLHIQRYLSAHCFGDHYSNWMLTTSVEPIARTWVRDRSVRHFFMAALFLARRRSSLSLRKRSRYFFTSGNQQPLGHSLRQPPSVYDRRQGKESARCPTR